ncbi:hypothetical protein PFMALIP_03550 [Plasmodium falciparum MaliPS096_E11]|uniref:Liver stage associated protein 1 n=1 Tax=Plasmodium falciparum MaliPS096_E11 TaxID=1036727 RepID=A0A024WN90_PLAFA|nr:hypothetical protein PFMALIP_03550 [Plasmodium falciparum MaliPS096_E11]
MKTIIIVTLFILILNTIIINPCTCVPNTLPIEYFDYETLKENVKIRDSNTKTQLIILSAVCASILLSLSSLWGIRIHYNHEMNKKEINNYELNSDLLNDADFYMVE